MEKVYVDSGQLFKNTTEGGAQQCAQTKLIYIYID
jgi:hypothetical protein